MIAEIARMAALSPIDVGKQMCAIAKQLGAAAFDVKALSSELNKLSRALHSLEEIRTHSVKLAAIVAY